MTGRRLARILAWPLIAVLRFYQLVISPMTPPSCRYYPSCSSYAITALERFGPIKGTYLAVWRVLRCNPWSAGGVDHVPERPHRHHHPKPDDDVTTREPVLITNTEDPT